MKVKIDHVSPISETYFHTPTAQGRELYLYPLCVGNYRYLPGYFLRRENYPGYSVMFVCSGHCHIVSDGKEADAAKGDIALVSGYTPHSYQTADGLDAYWIHFDGMMAERFYLAIIEQKGNVISPSVGSNCAKYINTIYDMYENNSRINEAVVSKYVTDILTELLNEATFDSVKEKRIRESIHYMNENFPDQLTVEALAAAACLSPYYYIRLFKKFTGSTPYSYLLSLRITHAKYYLKTTDKSIKEIAFLCGFTTESNFCNAFRKLCGNSPSQYRGISQ